MLKRLLAAALLMPGLVSFASLFSTSAIAQSSSLPPPVSVIEFYSPSLNHYFMSADPGEIAGLDNGVIGGWVRTGYQFVAWNAVPLNAALNPVCRFYGLPQAGLNSHFYSASPTECASIQANMSWSWQLESSDVFQVKMPDLTTGICPAGSVPIYRLFNNRPDANHRYTPDLTLRNAMVSTGYVSEGYGPLGVGFCAASATIPTTPWNATSTANFAVTQIAPDSFDFTSVTTTSAGVTIVSYAWNFGDGSVTSGASVSHQYTVSGTFPVVLTVHDSKGGTATATRNVTATVAPATPVPQGPPGSWTKYATSYAAGTEAEYQNWYNLTFDTKRNVFYGVDWSGVISSFDPNVGRWRKLNPPLGGGVHNRVTAYDPINDRVWLGDGTGTQLMGVNYFDPVSATWVKYPIAGPPPGAESAMIYDPAGKRFIVFGGWFRLGVYTFSLSPLASSMVLTNVAPGPTWDGGIAPDAKKMTGWRSDLDTLRNRIIYVDTDGSLWALPLSLSGWQHIGTTGGPPPALTQYVYDRANDALVGWSASPREAGGDTVTGTTRETWLLPLSTLVWSKAANVAVGSTVPPDTVYVGYAMAYDPLRQVTLLHTLNGPGDYTPETWAYRYPSTGTPPPPPTPPPTTPTPPPPPAAPPTPPPTSTYTGKITSFALPAQSGSTFGVNYYGLPFVSNGYSKQSDMAYCPLDNRLYVQGGDSIHSATDGTWSMSLVDGTWRFDHGAPVYPTNPAPHALQDDFGYAWVPSRNKLLLWPGIYFAYEAPGTPILNYSAGLWWYDPVTKSYTQDTRLFPNTPTNGVSPGITAGTTGSLFGGIYDEVQDQILEFGDSSGGGFMVHSWSVATMTRLPDIAFQLTSPKGYAAYFSRGMQVKVGRSVYIIGYRTNGLVSSQTPLMLRWDLDNKVMQELAPPPLDGTQIIDSAIRFGTSHGKIVWPFTTGPDGEIHGIYVYNPATNGWSVDNQVPTYGNFIGNSVTSLPDGRVVWSGGVFGRQQTHIWFYEAI